MFKLLLLLGLCASQSWAGELIVWNVGQGQWITEVHPGICLHYDLGGERNPIQKVNFHCQGKKNFVFLSHLDWDHISFLKSFSLQFSNACLMPLTLTSASSKKSQSLKSLPICSEINQQIVNTFTRTLFSQMPSKNSNDNSQIQWSRRFRVLIPGDSPRRLEKIWKDEVPTSTLGWILGHHGSRTSNSAELLQALPSLKWAVASARSQRYGHPHKEIVRRLKKEKVPLLKTEDWGHLHFIQNENSKN